MKKLYHAPKITDLSGMDVSALGVCMTGGSNGTTTCGSGSNAGGCTTGSLPGPSSFCSTGPSHVTACGTGGTGPACCGAGGTNSIKCLTGASPMISSCGAGSGGS